MIAQLRPFCSEFGIGEKVFGFEQWFSGMDIGEDLRESKGL